MTPPHADGKSVGAVAAERLQVDRRLPTAAKIMKMVN